MTPVFYNDILYTYIISFIITSFNNTSIIPISEKRKLRLRGLSLLQHQFPWIFNKVPEKKKNCPEKGFFKTHLVVF